MFYAWQLGDIAMDANRNWEGPSVQISKLASEQPEQFDTTGQFRDLNSRPQLLRVAPLTRVHTDSSLSHDPSGRTSRVGKEVEPDPLDVTDYILIG